jgi:peroxiredoxin
MNTDKHTEVPPPVRSKRYRRWLVEGGLAVVVIAALHGFQTRHLVRGQAPDFQARLLDDTSVALSDFRGGPLLLQFWATWCPVCRAELDSIDALAGNHQVLSVALDDLTREQMQAWMTERGLSFPVVLEDAAQIASLYGVRGVPSSLVLDESGSVQFSEVGYTTGMGLRLRLWWAGL